jgi:polyisoprenoid-binding protein YceI
MVLAVAAAVVVLGGFIVVQQFLAGDDVARLTLAPVATSSTDPSARGDASADPSADPSGDPSGSAGPSEATGLGSATAAELAGTWAVADGSVVGYRVREQLGGISALTDAVGRTSAVTGSATLEASGNVLAVTAASFEADLSQLESDEGRRDNRIRSIGLQSDQVPTGSFVLAETIDVPADALTGSTVDVTLTGALTIHGVTKTVAIPAQARLNGDRIEVVGALTFPFSDFGMTPPDVAGFVQVEDDATLEVLLSLVRA